MAAQKLPKASTTPLPPLKTSSAKWLILPSSYMEYLPRDGHCAVLPGLVGAKKTHAKNPNRRKGKSKMKAGRTGVGTTSATLPYTLTTLWQQRAGLL